MTGESGGDRGTSRRAAVGGHAMAWEEAGSGTDDVLLLVHGFPHRAAFWRPVLDALPAGWRGVAPDLPGFGDTPPRDDAPSIDAYADACVALLDHLGVARAVVGGLSMGGYVALALWRRHPARVRALVLADTRAGADGEEARAKRRETIELARTQGAAAVAEAQLSASVGRTTRAERPELVAALRRMFESASVPGLVAATEAMLGRPDSTSTLAGITVPTLVVVGAEDTITRPGEARALQEGVARSRLVVIEGAGHVSAFERPERFNAALRTFLAGLPGPEGG